MSLTIVAIPRQDDFVWNVSSEKIPHLTLLSLGDNVSEMDVNHIASFVQHATVLLQSPFGLSVDYRGELGDDKADVLFFDKSSGSFDRIDDFRKGLLQDRTIKKLFQSTPQFDEWTPHLTLGFPETPAKKDTRDFPGFNWMEFDKIAVWTGNFEGPEFQLKHGEVDSTMAMSFIDTGEEFIEHHGIKGMKWGVRRSRKALARESGKIPRSEDSQRHAANAKKPLHSLSDKDLKDLQTRLQTEANVRRLQKNPKRQGQQVAKAVLAAFGIHTVKQAAESAAAASLIATGASLAVKLIKTDRAVRTIAQF